MCPTLCATLGVKGRRPVVGTRDDKDQLHVFGSVNWADGRVHTNTLATRTKALRAARLAGRRAAVSKTRRMTATRSPRTCGTSRPRTRPRGTPAWWS